MFKNCKNVKYIDVSNWNFGSGAIYNNEGTIARVTGDFIDNCAKTTADGVLAYGGAIYNGDGASLKVVTGGKDIVFSGNYVSATGYAALALGGAIYNGASYEDPDEPAFSYTTLVQLCAEDGKAISFVGKDGEEIVDSVHNEGTLYVNKGAYTGTVNFANVTDAADDPTGKMYIENGTVNMKKAQWFMNRWAFFLCQVNYLLIVLSL